MKRSNCKQHQCSYEECDQNQGLSTFSRKSRYKIVKEYRLFIPASARFCSQHKKDDIWINYEGVVYKYTKDQIEDLLELLLNTNAEHSNQYTDEQMRSNTGLKLKQFHQLLSEIPSLAITLKSDELAETALMAYMKRLRTGHTYDQIRQSLGGMTHLLLKKYINAAREALLLDFVPKYLGFENLSREFLLENTTEMARYLYCQQNSQTAVIVWDGTYIYCNKSHNQSIQRQTYSVQKARNLLKPMVCVTTNGTYVDIFGPYEATMNDAAIMKSIFDKHLDTIMSKLEPGDVVLVDRGFRDNQTLFTQLGLVFKMPEFVTKNDETGQLTPEKANKSRLVTASRFCIEARNGNIKTIFHVFDTRWCAYDLQHLGEDYRIGAALINKFFQKINPNKDDSREIANAMLARVLMPNSFHDIVSNKSFITTIKAFKNGNVQTLEFPELTKADLKKISLGSYQINLMPSYCIEHLKANENVFKFWEWDESSHAPLLAKLIAEKNVRQPVVILVDLHSRFRASKFHRLFVMADTAVIGADSIVGYTCECRHGLRTVGCCGHIMAVIGYFSFYRHNPDQLKEVSAFLNNLFQN